MRQNGECSDTPVKGYRRLGQPWPQPTCDCCFKELFDSLTCLPNTSLSSTPFIPLTALSPPCCFPFSAVLIKPGDPSGRLWFPSPDCYCSEVCTACPHTSPVKPTDFRRLCNEWSATSTGMLVLWTAPVKSCTVNLCHQVARSILSAVLNLTVKK